MSVCREEMLRRGEEEADAGGVAERVSGGVPVAGRGLPVASAGLSVATFVRDAAEFLEGVASAVMEAACGEAVAANGEAVSKAEDVGLRSADALPEPNPAVALAVELPCAMLGEGGDVALALEEALLQIPVGDRGAEGDATVLGEALGELVAPAPVGLPRGVVETLDISDELGRAGVEETIAVAEERGVVEVVSLPLRLSAPLTEAIEEDVEVGDIAPEPELAPLWLPPDEEEAQAEGKTVTDCKALPLPPPMLSVGSALALPAPLLLRSALPLRGGDCEPKPLTAVCDPLPLAVTPPLAVAARPLPLGVALEPSAREGEADCVPLGEALSFTASEGLAAPVADATPVEEGGALLLRSGVGVSPAGPNEGLPVRVIALLPVPGSSVAEWLAEKAAVGVLPPPGLRLEAVVAEGEGVEEGVPGAVASEEGDAPPNGLPLARDDGEAAPGVNVAARRGDSVGTAGVMLCAPLVVPGALPVEVPAKERVALPLSAPLGVAIADALSVAGELPEVQALALPVERALGSDVSETGAVAESVGADEKVKAAVKVADPVADADALPVPAAVTVTVAEPLAVPPRLPLATALAGAVTEGVAQLVALLDCGRVPDEVSVLLKHPAALPVARSVPELVTELVAVAQTEPLSVAIAGEPVALPNDVTVAAATVALAAKQAEGVLLAEGGGVMEAVALGLCETNGEDDEDAVGSILALAGAFVGDPPLSIEALPFPLTLLLPLLLAALLCVWGLEGVPLLQAAELAVAAPPLTVKRLEGVTLDDEEAAPPEGEAETEVEPPAPPPLLPLAVADEAMVAVANELSLAVAEALLLQPVLPVDVGDTCGEALASGALAVTAAEADGRGDGDKKAVGEATPLPVARPGLAVAAAGEAVTCTDSLRCGEALTGGLIEPPPLTQAEALGLSGGLSEGVPVPPSAPPLLKLAKGVAVTSVLEEKLRGDVGLPLWLPVPVPCNTVPLPAALVEKAADSDTRADVDALCCNEGVDPVETVAAPEREANAEADAEGSKVCVGEPEALARATVRVTDKERDCKGDPETEVDAEAHGELEAGRVGNGEALLQALEQGLASELRVAPVPVAPTEAPLLFDARGLAEPVGEGTFVGDTEGEAAFRE